MPIQESQVNFFTNNPIPVGLKLSEVPQSESVRKGKEAVVIKVGDLALKWYAKFSGSTVKELADYAHGIDLDEKKLIDSGVKADQLPNSSFVIASFDEESENSTPELFAIQKWEEGRLLKDVSFWEVVRNQPLRQSLVNLYSGCIRVYQEHGKFPDLIGGETIKIGPFEVEDPMKFVNPLKTTNILIKDDNAMLLDARFLNLRPGSFKYQVARVHHYVTRGFTAFLSTNLFD